MLVALVLCSGHPVQPRTKVEPPVTPRAACISIADASIANVVDNEWCNENCGGNPDAEVCEDKCKCSVTAVNLPNPDAGPAPDACKSSDPAIAVTWCDQNCKERQTEDICEPCDCPCRDGDDKCIQHKKMKGRKDPPAPVPRILGGWTNCGPDQSKLKLKAKSPPKAKHEKELPSSGDCSADEDSIRKAFAIEVGHQDAMTDPSYSHEWGATAILPGRFGADTVAPIVGESTDYTYYWLTFGGEDTDSSNWAETAEQDILDAGANGAAFDIEGGVTKEGMTQWIKKMRGHHPHWTFVHVPRAGTEYFDDGSHDDDFVGYDPENGGPDRWTSA